MHYILYNKERSTTSESVRLNIINIRLVYFFWGTSSSATTVLYDPFIHCVSDFGRFFVTSMQLSAGRRLMVRCRLPAVSGIRSFDVGRRFRTFASSASSIVQERAPIAGYDWDSLGFALNTKETEMVVVEGTADGWSEAKVMPYAPLSVEPSAVALNYGQALF